MSFTPHRRRTKIVNHFRKVAYSSKVEARGAALRVRKEIGQSIVWYPCYINGPTHWHIGHPEKIDRMQQRIDQLEATVANQNKRLAALEQQVSKPKLKVIKGKKSA